MTGVIFDIKRFAVHDGPGIRTTVFLKGCPLRCQWCQNPEGLGSDLRAWHFPRKCIHCGRCVSACPTEAIAMDPAGADSMKIDQHRCTKCGQCIESCPAEALAMDGRTVSVEEVMRDLLADRVFYETSAGGVTLSGGEPLAQPMFAAEILQRCKNEQLHTAIETCLAVPGDVLESVLPQTDLFLCDLKVADSDEHRHWTGCDNAVILENFETIVRSGRPFLVRIPLIPGATATEENIRRLAAWLGETAPGAGVELINFNPLARQKYHRLGETYAFEQGRTLPDADVQALYNILEAAGLACECRDGSNV
jgi:pyruvate formate lyase activating enzyme